MAVITNAQKKELAKTLYLSSDLNQKEIAEKVGAMPKTISKWIKEGKWDTMRSSITATREEELARMYQMLNNINVEIMSREEGKRFPSSTEANTIAQLAAAIKKFEDEAGLPDIISVFKRFLDWLRPIDLDTAKLFVEYQDSFIKDTLSKMK